MNKFDMFAGIPGGDGIALTSVQHPPGKISYVREPVLRDSSLWVVDVPHDPDRMQPQGFYLAGQRVLYREDAHRLLLEHDWVRAQIADLLCSLIAWLAIQMPVVKWRVEPEVTIRSNFGSEAQIVEMRARGFLDQYVRAGDHQVWMVEL